MSMAMAVAMALTLTLTLTLTLALTLTRGALQHACGRDGAGRGRRAGAQRTAVHAGDAALHLQR